MPRKPTPEPDPVREAHPQWYSDTDQVSSDPTAAALGNTPNDDTNDTPTDTE